MSEQEIVDAEIIEETPAAPQGPIEIAVIGDDDNVLAQATYRAFDVPKGVNVNLYPFDQLDACIESKPTIVFWCDEIGIKKNDVLDDGEFIASVNRVIRANGSGVCIRTPLNIETFERLIMSLGKQAFDNKIVYMPELSDSTDIETLINSDRQLVGGTPEALNQHMSILRNMSWFGARTINSGTIPEVIYVKLATSGLRLVQQTFFDQLHEAVLDMKNANPMTVNRLMESNLLPSNVSGRDVYDARIFAGATDTLTLIDHCLEK